MNFEIWRKISPQFWFFTKDFETLESIKWKALVLAAKLVEKGGKKPLIKLKLMILIYKMLNFMKISLFMSFVYILFSKNHLKIKHPVNNIVLLLIHTESTNLSIIDQISNKHTRPSAKIQK